MVLICVSVATTFASVAIGQTTSRSMVSCQKKLISQVQSLTRFSARRLQGCTDKVVKCKLAAEIDAVDPTDCLANAATACGKVGPVLTNAIAKRRSNVLKACGLIPIAELEQFIAGLGFLEVSASCGSLGPPLSPIAVTDAASLVDCTLATTECAVEREVFLRDPRAVDSLTEVGQAATFPCVGS
jgi:hypothetical protein